MLPISEELAGEERQLKALRPGVLERKKSFQNFEKVRLQKKEAGAQSSDLEARHCNLNTIGFGMGMATLISTTGFTCIKVANVDGVKISGLLL